MIHMPRWKIFLILGTCFLGLLFASPNFFSKNTLESFPSWYPKNQVSLGLDLQGGAHLLLEVDFNAVLKEQMAATVDAVRTTLRKDRIGYTGLKAQHDKVTLTLRNLDAVSKSKSLLRVIDRELDVSITSEGKVTLQLSEKAIRERQAATLKQSIEIVRRRVDETGTSEPIIQRQGTDRILVQLPGLGDPTRIKKLLGETAKLHFRLVDQSVPIAAARQGKVPPESEVLPDYTNESKNTDYHYLIYKKILVSGENLVDAQPGFQDNRPVVNFKFDSLGAKRFGDATLANVGRPFAIVLDNKVLSTPNIKTPILGGSAYIEGRFTVQEAQDLALLMRAGALPAPLHILEERTVGPGLGADSIAAGENATLIAIIIVFVFMLIAYYFFGIVANIALFFNILILMAALSVTGATLTLPGIAGIALTIGMAVDANVLIYERIKEELRNGRKILGAVEMGYKRAMTTIVDSNVTTLIGAALLYHFGTGPVRGFAVTLSFGILISMFTAISLTRLVVIQWLGWRKPKKLVL